MYIAETNAVAVVIVFEPHSCRGILHTTLCDKVCQGLATGWRGFFLGRGVLRCPPPIEVTTTI
jgi:hypothetical protein